MFEGIFGLVGFLLWIVLVIWVYKDCENRPNNRVFWTVLAFLFPFLGTIAYLLFRKPEVITNATMENIKPT